MTMQKNAWQLMQQQPTVELPPELANANPAARLEAWQRMRVAMSEQVDRLNAERENLVEQRSSHLDPGLEARIAALDARVSTIHQRMALVDEEIVRVSVLAPARTETRTEVRVPDQPAIPRFPEELIAVPVFFILCVALPLSIAYARRIWRRAGEIGTGVPKEVIERLNRMDQNIDAIALEVERIGESQRYIAKQSEKERADLKA